MSVVMAMWMLSAARGAVLREAFPTPVGAQRAEASAFGRWLRELEVEAPETPVLTFDGRRVGHRARVVALPMVAGDLQQCADSVLRARAEWLREQGLPVVFHATSGDPIAWERWRNGERPYESGGRLAWRQTDRTGTWDGYLAAVFTWAGTRSLSAYDTVPASGAPQPGDVLVDPGSPGHAVLVLDVARRDDRTWVLVGEGYMPAQSFHVELGPVGGWWPWEDGVALPHWPLDASTLRRWP